MSFIDFSSLFIFVEGEIGFYVRSRRQSNAFDVLCLARVQFAFHSGLIPMFKINGTKYNFGAGNH